MENVFFTQCACVLFERAPAPEDLADALDDWAVEPQAGAEGDAGWMVAGPGLHIPLRSGGFAMVDVVERSWPDDPKAAEAEPGFAAAWAGGSSDRSRRRARSRARRSSAGGGATGPR